jgi:hypothetical protein
LAINENLRRPAAVNFALRLRATLIDLAVRDIIVKALLPFKIAK